MIEGLQHILEKDIVISTVNADDLLRTPHQVDSTYEHHAMTFIPLGDVGDYAQRFLKRITAAKTPKGMLVAPYGYGKTSTLIFLWHECQSKGVLAVPPFYCASLLDILKATYAWVKYRLEQREPDLVAELERVHHKYTIATVEAMAERYSKEHGVATLTAVNMLNDLLAKGALVLELTPANLLFFLDETLDIALKAGFKGLAIFPDEFQQYISKGANLRKVIQEFREFVWGLGTRRSPLGVIFSVPSYTEGGIQSHGGDILDRLKDDGLYRNLRDIYTQEFPAQLWERYAEAFNLGEVAAQVMDPYTLRAIGQIAEREDLGRGPRTVIDAFKCAILHFQDHGTPYAPVDLIDDFLYSKIHFEAQANKLRTVTRQALESQAVDTPDKERAIKLMAAFPRGCPVEVQKAYGLYDAVNALSKPGHGELMTHLIEGYTLLGLQRAEGPTHVVDIMTTEFWRDYEEDEFHVEAAQRTFMSRVLPRLFQARRGAAAIGWSSPEFTLSATGSYVALIEGSFNPRYPKRNLALQVAYQTDQLQRDIPHADIQFDFLFLWDPDQPHEASGTIVTLGDRTVRFCLNMRRKVGEAIPDDIRKLQDFVNPEYVTPLLMLGLIDYFDHWEEQEGHVIPDKDRAELEYLINRLITNSIQLLFNDELRLTCDPPLRRVGDRMVEEVFNRKCQELYPDYHTFYVQAQYQAVLNDYIQALRDLTLKQRRGHAPLKGDKNGLARRFGLTSVATFENRARSDYQHLMTIVEWKGNKGELLLKLHPLEELILKRLRESPDRRVYNGVSAPVLPADSIAEMARPLGYRDEEILFALQLLAARGYTRTDAEAKLIYLVTMGPDPRELRARLDKLADDLKAIPAGLLEPERLKGFQATLVGLESRFSFDLGDEELDELQTQTLDLDEQITQTVAATRSQWQEALNNLIYEIEHTLIALRQSDLLDREITGQMGFVMHLNELRLRLLDGRKRLRVQYEKLKRELLETQARRGEDVIRDTIALYQSVVTGRARFDELEEQRAAFEGQTTNLGKWAKVLRDADNLFNALARLPDLRDQLTGQVEPEIRANFVKRKLEALEDWEQFAAKIDAIEAELEKRRAYGNEIFGQAKEEYEKFLRDIEVRDFRPRTRYTYGEDQESYRDLYEEVRSKISGRLDEIRRDLEQLNVDLLKARYIQATTSEQDKLIKRMEKQWQGADRNLRHLRSALNISLIQKAGDELVQYCDLVKAVVASTQEMRRALGPVLFAEHELTDEEEQTLQAFGNRDEVDLADLFVQLRQAGLDIELGDLMKSLEKLYRKNRVIVRVRRRG